MKKIYDVNVRMTDNGTMVVIVRYIENDKLKTIVEPFSEELLLKYKKKYEKEKVKEKRYLKKVKEETDTEKININANFFIELALVGGTIAISLAGIAATAFLCAKTISSTFDTFKDLESPILPEQEIEYNIEMHKSSIIR